MKQPERAQLTVLATDNDDGLLAHEGGDEIAGLADLVKAARELPGAAEDGSKLGLGSGRIKGNGNTEDALIPCST